MNDYLIHYNHNHDALGRFARSAGSAGRAVGNKITGKKDKKNTMRKYESTKRLASKKSTKAVEVSRKQKGSKSNNTKLSESDRRRLVEHASVKEVIANKDKLSNRELESAITRLQKEKNNRMDLEKKLSDLNNPVNEKNAKSFVDKMSDVGNTLNKATTAVDNGVKAYNMAAKIHNTTSKDKWPIVGENNKDKANILKMQKVVMTGSLADVWKSREKMTPAQYENAVKRFKNDAEMQKMMNNENTNSSSKSNNTSSNNSQKKDRTPDHQSFFQEKQQRPVESWKEVREQAAPIIEERSKDRVSVILENYPDYNDDWYNRRKRY